MFLKLLHIFCGNKAEHVTDGDKRRTSQHRMTE